MKIDGPPLSVGYRSVHPLVPLRRGQVAVRISQTELPDIGNQRNPDFAALRHEFVSYAKAGEQSQ